MQQIVCSTLSRAIAFALRYDSVTKENVSAWAGKSLYVSLSDWRLDLLFTITSGGSIQVSSYQDTDDPDASITGTLSGFLHLGIKRGDTAAVRDAGISIDGDAAFAQGLRKIMSELAIDWEGALAAGVGDTLARRVAAGVDDFMSAVRGIAKRQEDNMGRYLTAETSALPTQQEVTRFIKDVTILRYDVDRLLARYDASTQEKKDD